MKKGSSSFLDEISCVVFDFGFTLCADHYFNYAPPYYPDWQQLCQEIIFKNTALVNEWIRGELSLVDIAYELSKYVSIDPLSIVKYLEKGCENLKFNKEVWDFANGQRKHGRKTALVTLNMDVFTEVVVPSHNLHNVFDVIINAADFHQPDKKILWDIAFCKLGDGITYYNSLLIDDREEHVKRFKELGGSVHHYSNDNKFRDWLNRIGWGN